MSDAKKSTRLNSRITRAFSSSSVWSKPFTRLAARVAGLLNRRPHRSFRRTRRRDYVRPLQLPGYWKFTSDVRQLLWRQKWLYLGLALTYGMLTAVFVGLGSQTTYVEIGDTLQASGGDLFEGNFGSISKAGLLLLAGVSGNFSGEVTAVQQVFAVLFVLLTWLTTVWLLRASVAGHRLKLRDGLYSAGAPLIATFLVSLLLVVQLLPLALAVIGFTAASGSGMLNGGVEAMLFWSVAALLGLLSLYWMVSTFLALIVVTLPGMYPMQAIKTAGDLAIGRRLPILLRMLWLIVGVAVLWALIMVPIILIDGWIKSLFESIAWLPVVPVAILIMSSLTTVAVAAYVYLLYRRIVDDGSAPA